MNLTLRSTEQEWMDAEDVTLGELEHTFEDLNRVNSWLGGNRITINAVRKLINTHPKKSYTILDVGCGDGNMLRELSKVLQSTHYHVKLYGLELRDDLIAYAREKSEDYDNIEYVRGDIFRLNEFKPDIDIVLCTLTLHHFEDKSIVSVVQGFCHKARIGIVVNDLHRSRLAYYLFKLFSLFFLKTAMAKNDGLVSIKRAFIKKELKEFSTNLPHASHTIAWKWAFRYLWMIRPKRNNEDAVPR